jgi:DNA-binding Lrp family transcriptional regulator
MASALLDPNNLEILKYLMTSQWSIGALSDVLQLPLAKIYYRVRKLEKLGIVCRVRSEARHGRAIAHYQILETNWFIPFELTPASTPAELIASSFRPGFEQFLRRFGSLAERFTTPQVWGVHVQLKSDDLDFELTPPRPAPHLTGTVLGNWSNKRLSRERALVFATRLEALIAEFDAMPEEPGAPEQLLGAFFIEQAARES